MKVESICVWEDQFFQRFFEFKNQIHRDIVTSFPEDLTDYSKFFGPDSPFAIDTHWRAFLISDGDGVIAKAILCWKKDSRSGNLGFIDFLDHPEASALLFQSAEASAREAGLSSLKTPVDLNFFVKYRIRCPGGEAPFYGEPIYPDYYHEHFKRSGYVVTNTWDTYRLKKIESTIDYLTKRYKLGKKKEGSHHKTKNKKLKTTIRNVRLHDWENEMRIIYDLFSRAYQNMPEYEPVTFEQFRLVYDDFKHIINPFYAYIIELRGVPVGFSINYVDPLPILAKYRGKKPNLLQKGWILARLKLNTGTFMIAHSGKVPGPNGEEIKGVQIMVSNRISAACVPMRKVITTYLSTDAPSRRSFEFKFLTQYAKYVLYGKNLE